MIGVGLPLATRARVTWTDDRDCTSVTPEERMDISESNEKKKHCRPPAPRMSLRFLEPLTDIALQR